MFLRLHQEVFLQKVPSFYHRHSHSYQKFLATFLKSILKFGKEGTEVGFFAKLIDQNVSVHITLPLNESIKILKKKYHEVLSRGDDTFKKVKVSFNDMFQILNQVFKKRITRYDRLNDVPLKSRLKEYVLKANVIHSSILEVSGLVFLSIVIQESESVKEMLLSDPNVELGNPDDYGGDNRGSDEHENDEKKSSNYTPHHKLISSQNQMLGYSDNGKKASKIVRIKSGRDEESDDDIEDDDQKDYDMEIESELPTTPKHNQEKPSIKIKRNDHNSGLTTPINARPPPSPSQKAAPGPESPEKGDYETFYRAHDILGFEDRGKSRDNIQYLKHMKNIEDRIFAFPDPLNNHTDINDRDNSKKRYEDFEFTISKKPTSDLTTGKSFNDIYNNVIINKKEDSKHLELIRECDMLEKKIAQIDEEYNSLSLFVQPLNKYKKKVTETYKDRLEMSSFMKMMIPVMGVYEDIGVYDMEEDILSLYDYYIYMYEHMKTYIVKDDIHAVDRHTVDEYYQFNHIYPHHHVSNQKDKLDNHSQGEGERDNNTEGNEMGDQQEGEDGGDNDKEKKEDEDKNGTRRFNSVASSNNGYSHRDALRRKRRENEKKEKLNGNNNLEGYDSQQEFEHHERQARINNNIQYESDEQPNLFHPVPYVNATDDDENDRYRKRLMQQAYKRLSPRNNGKNLQKIEIIPLDNNGDGVDDNTMKPAISSSLADEAGEGLNRESRNLLHSGKLSRGNSAIRLTNKSVSVSKRNNNSRSASRDFHQNKTVKHQKPTHQVSSSKLTLPQPLLGIDSTKYEMMIYKTKKRKMYIALEDYRSRDRNYLSLRQGDIVCGVHEMNGWSFIYFEDNPKKFGFFPTDFLSLIN